MKKTFSSFCSQDDEQRRSMLISEIEHSVERLKLSELEALYYDMVTKDYIRK
ncbi:MAG: hypothetical protein ACOYJF_10265 [Prevotella sp.]